MRPSTTWLSKALRLPLNSKRGNADFYKGTRTGNILRRRRLPLMGHQGTRVQTDQNGREKVWTVRTHRIDESKIPSFVVPPGLADTRVSTPGRDEAVGIIVMAARLTDSLTLPPPFVLPHFQIQPYVHRAVSYQSDATGVQNPRPGYPALADGEETVALPPGGLDGNSYEQLRRIIWSRRNI
ncbi:unnamed protein product [Parajaminaea phylloscopi]